MNEMRRIAAWLRAGRDDPHATKVRPDRANAAHANNRRFGEFRRRLRSRAS